MRDQLKQWILHQVKIHNGISNLTLWINVSGLSVRFTSKEYHDALNELVKNGEIRMLEFGTLTSHGHTKQVYFTKETRFKNLQEFLVERTGDASEETDSGKGFVDNKSSPDV